jgi:hypothetical protein
METLHTVKTREIPDTPLVLFDCVATDGTVARWSTHAVSYEGQPYEPVVMRHNLFDMQAGDTSGVDGMTRLALTLGNATGRLSEIERRSGWKGAKLTARFVFFDLAAGQATTECQVVFRGVANPPDEITEATMRLSFANRLNLQRLLLPQLRIERHCPWCFPQSPAQRAEAVDGGVRGKHSPFFACGYSPDQAGGCGNLNAGQPYPSCGYTRQDCEQRGMFDRDWAGRSTRRFGGVEYVPSTIQVKGHGESSTHASSLIDNEARYNDVVPLVYGTAWYQPPIVFGRNDGNLTHLEVLLGCGEMTGVVSVLVDGVEIPKAVNGTDMTATGWFNLVTAGSRQGTFNTDFSDGQGRPLGDPYGSMALLGIVVPNRISDGKKAPKVQVLAQGLKLAVFDDAGNGAGEQFTNNPAWVLLDLLQRSGWTPDDLDLASFSRAAAHCAEYIDTQDLTGATQQIPRSGCNLALRTRKSAADVVRSVRTASGLLLRYGADGKLELVIEGTLAVQQPVRRDGSNASETLWGGWPAYEFGDGSSSFGDIARKDTGAPSIRFWSRSTADTANRCSIEFQDEFNSYQQDSLSLVDVDDAVAGGQEINGQVHAAGVPNFHQAGRVLRRQLDRSIRGNTYVEFQTGLRGIGLRPGDLITLTYLREGFERQPFRILRIAPAANCARSTITAQLHDDGWYAENGTLDSGRREIGLNTGIPRPLSDAVFTITESSRTNSDGSETVRLSVGFTVPAKPVANGPALPLLDLTPRIDPACGTLRGGSVWYYAISAMDSEGNESPLSFVVRAEMPAGLDTFGVSLTGLSFGAGAAGFRVYRGTNPQQLSLIADTQAVAKEFVDDGRPALAVGPPDANFDHANFYWRLESLPESPVSSASATTLSSDLLSLAADEYRGQLARITKGVGAGQERRILSNTDKSLTVAPAWHLAPDQTSAFVIVDNSWQFGALGVSSPVSVEVPNRSGATVEICGRAANVYDLESAYELSPITPWRIGGAGASGDADVPPEPVFALTTKGQGVVEVAGIGFGQLTNTASVSGATLTLHYVDEVQGNPEFALRDALDSAAGSAAFTGGQIEVGKVLLCGLEILRVLDGPDQAGIFAVERGAFGSPGASHASGDSAIQLARRTVVLPFVKNFFGSAASGAYSYPVRIPNVRIAAAEMFATNEKGSGLTHPASFTNTVANGLRTLSGGQLAFQVSGYLAIQSNAVPPLNVEADSSIRDISASLGQASTGGPVVAHLNRNGATWCELIVPSGEVRSTALDGASLPALREGDVLTLDVVYVGHDAGTLPGRDLTVTVRL